MGGLSISNAINNTLSKSVTSLQTALQIWEGELPSSACRKSQAEKYSSLRIDRPRTGWGPPASAEADGGRRGSRERAEGDDTAPGVWLQPLADRHGVPQGPRAHARADDRHLPQHPRSRPRQVKPWFPSLSPCWWILVCMSGERNLAHFLVCLEKMLAIS